MFPQPFLDDSLPSLHGMTKQFNTPVIITTLYVPLILVEWYQRAGSPFLRHLACPQDHVEKFGEPDHP